MNIDRQDACQVRYENYKPREGFDLILEDLKREILGRLPDTAICQVLVKGAEEGFVVAVDIFYQNQIESKKIYLSKEYATGLDRHWLAGVINKLVDENLAVLYSRHTAS